MCSSTCDSSSASNRRPSAWGEARNSSGRNASRPRARAAATEVGLWSTPTPALAPAQVDQVPSGAAADVEDVTEAQAAQVPAVGPLHVEPALPPDGLEPAEALGVSGLVGPHLRAVPSPPGWRAESRSAAPGVPSGSAGAEAFGLAADRALARVARAGHGGRRAGLEVRPVHLREPGGAQLRPAGQHDPRRAVVTGGEDRPAARVREPERLVDVGRDDRLAQARAVFDPAVRRVGGGAARVEHRRQPACTSSPRWTPRPRTAAPRAAAPAATPRASCGA